MNTLNVASTAMTNGSATGNPNNKVALKKGRGLMDWVRLSHTKKNLSLTEGKILEVTLEELAKHNKKDNAWIALNGKVYNITPYFEYHPGGEDELLRGVGIDATDLFNEIHKWVNYESLLKSCLVGTLVQSKFNFLQASNKSTLNVKLPSTSRLPTFPKISLSLPAPPNIGGLMWKPKYDWFQTTSTINIAIYTKWEKISQRHIIISCKEQQIKIYVYIRKAIFIVHVDLHDAVENNVALNICSTGKVEITFKKRELNNHWPTLGKSLSSDEQLNTIKNTTIDYYSWKIIAKTKVTHDTYLFQLYSEDVLHFGVALGFHVFIGLPNIDIRRPYTPVIYPINDNISQNYKTIKFFIKIYPSGILTSQLGFLSKDAVVEVGIPQGSFSCLQYQRMTEMGNLLLLAAGTGITPFPALISSILKTKISIKLIFFNKTEDDIPWHEEFQKLEETGYFSITHVLSKPKEDWKGATGCITKELLQKDFTTEKSFVCICGPKSFNELVLQFLEELNVSESNIHSFLG